MTDLQRKICKTVLKPDFTALVLMESLSEFGPRDGGHEQLISNGERLYSREVQALFRIRDILVRIRTLEDPDPLQIRIELRIRMLFFSTVQDPDPAPDPDPEHWVQGKGGANNLATPHPLKCKVEQYPHTSSVFLLYIKDE